MKEINRIFDYNKIQQELLKPEIVQVIAEIYEHKGKQELFVKANADDLSILLGVAKIQSTGASNRIEGIYTSDKRLAELVLTVLCPDPMCSQKR